MPKIALPGLGGDVGDNQVIMVWKKIVPFRGIQ
jgi:hypothetical protein